MTKNEALFLDPEEDNFASKSANLSAEKANFAPILTKDLKKETKKDMPPKGPPPEKKPESFDELLGLEPAESLRDSDGSPNDRRPIPESLRFPETAKSFSKSNENDDEFSEPLIHKKKEKQPKTRKEAQQVAMQKIANGHIANPLGITNNRKRRLDWKRACDIDETGAVTTAQLNRHLIKLWNSAFGTTGEDKSILELMVSQDRTNMTKEFGDITQAFIDTVNFEPTYRDLAEYFTWFLDPKRISKMLQSARFSGGVHFQMLKGGGFIKNFYDQVIEKRPNSKYNPAGISKAEESLDLLERMFTEFKEAYSDNYEFAKKMVANGYALTAQWLHEERNMNDSECRQRIIFIMAEFIKAVPIMENAIEFLKLGLTSTKEHAYMLREETCVWFDWKQKTNDLIDVAIEQAQKK